MFDWADWTSEAARKRSVSRWTRKNKILINSLWSLPDVLVITGIKEIALGLLLHSVRYFRILSSESSFSDLSISLGQCNFPLKSGLEELPKHSWVIRRSGQGETRTMDLQIFVSFRSSSCLLLIDKARDTDKTYIWVSGWWKTINERWGIYAPHIHWVARGTGTPKDRDDVSRRDVCECDGWVKFKKLFQQLFIMNR